MKTRFISLEESFVGGNPSRRISAAEEPGGILLTGKLET